MIQEIKDYPAYGISKDGTVFSKFKYKTNKLTDNWREVKPVIDKGTGYKIVTLCTGTGDRQNKRVHRLLMETFIPNPYNLPQINHKDGNKLNIDLDNLEWCTPQQNSQHSYDTGLSTSEHCIVAVAQYTKDNLFINKFKSIKEAENATGIANQNIWKVCNNRRKTAGGFIWKYV